MNCMIGIFLPSAARDGWWGEFNRKPIGREWIDWDVS